MYIKHSKGHKLLELVNEFIKVNGCKINILKYCLYYKHRYLGPERHPSPLRHFQN